MGKLYLGTQEIGAAYAPTVTSPEVYIPLEVSPLGALGKPNDSYAWSVPSTATKINARALYYAFYGDTHLTSVDLSSVTEVEQDGMYDAFYGCTALTSIDLSNLTTIRNYGLRGAFGNCRITTLDLSSLTNIGQQGLCSAFEYSSVTSADLSSVSVVGNMGMDGVFSYCHRLTSVDLRSVSVIGTNGFSWAFTGCRSLTSLSFPALTTSSFGTNTNQFYNMLQGCSGVTVHFPSAIQSTIGNWSDVTNGFGGTNTTVLFDL